MRTKFHPGVGTVAVVEQRTKPGSFALTVPGVVVAADISIFLSSYDHGDLADSLLEAVDHIARQFGLEAVTLRACAKLLGVAPSAGFRHYADKRSLFTAFATRAQQRMAEKMSEAARKSSGNEETSFLAVALAYVEFALDEPTSFRGRHWKFFCPRSD